MALGRLDIPGLILYNGHDLPGHGRDKGQRNATVVTIFEAIGAYRAGKITPRRAVRGRERVVPGPGRVRRPVHRQHDEHGHGVPRPVAGRASTASRPRTRPRTRPRGAAGELVMGLVRDDLRPSSFVTRASIENAIASVAATGGSTNGVLHLLAIAHEYGIPLEIDEFGADRRPDADRRRPPARRPLHRDPPVRRRRRRPRHRASCSPAGLIDGDAPNVDGRTIAEIAAAAVATDGPGRRRPDRRRRSSRPAASRSSAARSRPDGCVVKLAGHERRLHRGPARVFDSEAECYAAVRDRRIVRRRRRRHPLRGPGRRARDAGDAERHRRRSSARASATRSRSSPTAGSRAAPTA